MPSDNSAFVSAPGTLLTSRSVQRQLSPTLKLISLEQDLVSRFTLDSATEFLFGHCVHSLSAGLPYSPNFPPPPGAIVNNEANPANQFAKAFGEAQNLIARRGHLWVRVGAHGVLQG